MLMSPTETLWVLGILVFFISLIPPAIHYSRSRIASRAFEAPPAVDFRPSLTVLLPMKDEKTNVSRKIDELLSMSYPKDQLRLLVIDSGSTDGTDRLAQTHLEENASGVRWKVISLDRPGKSVAVNHALGIVDSEVFVMMDADSISGQDTLERLANWFAQPEIGAVCGQLKHQWPTHDLPYRRRFNTIRVGESVMDSTPIFEGSVCAFRTKAIGDSRIDPNINADDSQLAMLVRTNGYRALMDPKILFIEDSNANPSRGRKVRRAQGLSRALVSNFSLIRQQGKYSSIVLHSLYFHLVMPWLVLASLTSVIGASAIEYLYSPPAQELTPNGIVMLGAILLLFISSTARGLLVGISILLESHIRLLLGQKLNVWSTDRQD